MLSRGLDVVGLSMGGVVGRYALASLEGPTGQSHPVATFVSVDAPQQGAVVDPLFQQYFEDNRCVTHSINCIPATDIPRALWGPAGQQLL